MSKTYSIGLDLGTTSVKACAFDTGGELIKVCSNNYELEHPEPGAAEQDPQAVLDAASNSLQDLVSEMGSRPTCIGISTAMHSVILLNAEYEPVSPVITWADTRSVAVIDDFSEEQKKALLRRTGTPVHPMSPLVKLRWLPNAKEDWWAAMEYVSDLKSLLVQHWTEEGLLLDTNLASATGLYNLKDKNWDKEALAVAGITVEKLPEVVEPTRVLRWNKSIAKELGLEGVPLVIGGSDGCLANLGSELKKGDVAISIGTSGAIRTTHQQLEVDPEAGLFNYHILGDDYALGGATNNGAKIMEWLFELLGEPFDDIGSMIEAAAEVDSDGLTFVPYVYGERAPIYDANATGAFTGIRGHHIPAQYARAALEGVTGNLVKILKKLEKINDPAKRLVASGGFTRSPFWVDLLAEKSGRKVILADTAQASAYGAVLVAKKAIEQ